MNLYDKLFSWAVLQRNTSTVEIFHSAREPSALKVGILLSLGLQWPRIPSEKHPGRTAMPRDRS